MFLFKVSFNSLIKILSWISNLKLHELLARIKKSSGQTTLLQKSIWSCMAEVWELFLIQFPVSGETPICSKVCIYDAVWFMWWQLIHNNWSHFIFLQIKTERGAPYHLVKTSAK